MNAAAYKIRMADGKFSRGGTDLLRGLGSKKGKAWASRGALKAHIRLIYTYCYPKYKNPRRQYPEWPYEGARVVGFEVVDGEVNTIDVPIEDFWSP